MAKVDLSWNNALSLRKHSVSAISVGKAPGIFQLTIYLSKTEKLETEDQQLINILFLFFQVIFCHVFGNFTERLVSFEEAAQNSC